MRLAIYYTPDPESPLGTAGSSWLGRKPDSQHRMPLPEVPGLRLERLAELVKTPCHYGFHATIKAPFRLKPGMTVKRIQERLERFADEQEPFLLPALSVQMMSGFFCLRPEKSCPQLQDLAESTVRFFDAYRAPPGPEELLRRRTIGLSGPQEKLLARWGYPYVMEEFRFHLSLTDRITSITEKQTLEHHLHAVFTPAVCSDIFVNSLSLFIEQDEQPFILLKTFPFS